MLVIMDKSYYRDKLVHQDHLNNTTYTEIESNADTKVVKSLKMLAETYKDDLTEKEFSYITKFECESSNLYVVPKIHKCKTIVEAMKRANSVYIEMDPPDDLKARPIVAGPNSPTQKLSELLEKILSPLVPRQKSYIKDDWDFQL